MIGRNEQNQSNKQFNFNLKRCRPKGSNNTAEKLRIPSSLISRVKKNWPKNRCECNQEITAVETEKTAKSFESNKSLGNDGIPTEFYKAFNEILKTDLHKLYIEISQLEEIPRSMPLAVISVCKKRRQRGHNYLAPNLATRLWQ